MSASLAVLDSMVEEMVAIGEHGFALESGPIEDIDGYREYWLISERIGTERPMLPFKIKLPGEDLSDEDFNAYAKAVALTVKQSKDALARFIEEQRAKESA